MAQARARRSTRTARPRPKTPARVKKRRREATAQRAPRRRADRARASSPSGSSSRRVLWFGLSGGPVPDAAASASGWAAYLLPVVLVPVGLLMVTRSSLVAVGPFKLGLGLTIAGFLIALGSAHGGWAGRHARERPRARDRRHRRDDPRRDARPGRRALPHRRLARRAPAPLRPRGAPRLDAASAGGSRSTAEPKPAPTPEPTDSFHPLPEARRRRSTPCTTTPTSSRRRPCHAPIPLPLPVSASRPTTTDATRHAASLFDAGDDGAEARVPAPRPRAPAPLAAGRRARTPTRTRASARRCSSASPTSASRRRIVGTITGPRVTRYELQLAPGIKVGKVAQLRDDLCYALATTEIRILAPIPGKQAVGVEVPNLSPNLVTLGDIFGDIPPQASPLAVWLGKGIDGVPVYCDLARMPHLLIAGTTGSGKSGCINAILTSILLRSTPGPGADDPDRPQADRAQPLRVDPAPADAGRLEPEGGERRPPQRRHRDGAPLRAPRAGARPRAPRGEPRASASAASRSCRTCSS